MHFDDGKLINQEAFFINLRQKRKVLNHLKGELSCLELKIPDIHELTVQKKEAKKEYSSRIPITAIINVKGRSYFGTA